MDKASRIATLEIEMARMEDEFSRELTQLGQKITNESESSQYWQQKHSTLHQQFLKVDTDLRILRRENSVREKQREERDRDLKTRVSSLILDRDTLRDAYHAKQAELKARDQEMMQMRAQIKGLKDFVSVNSRMDGQITDEVLGDMMRSLGNGLQNWVISNFRRSKLSETQLCISLDSRANIYLDVETMSLDMREKLATLVPTFESLAANAKIHLIQSIVSRLLVLTIFNSYYVGLPDEQAVQLRDMEDYLATLTDDIVSVNQWRAGTIALLRKGSLEQLSSGIEAVVGSLTSRLNDILIALTDVSASEARDNSLQALIMNAIDLSRLLRLQKAVFKPMMPVIKAHQITTFDFDTMEDIGGEDEDDLQSREICCVTFPGLVKEGDETGEQSQLRNIVAKVRVLCSPD